MFDHLGLRTARLDASIRFYEAALAPLGYQLASRDEQGAGLGPPGAPALWLYRAPEQSGAGPRTAIQGLYLASAWTMGGGYTGAMLGGAAAVREAARRGG